MPQKITYETGRTLMELLATLGVIAILSVGAIRSYNFIVGRSKAYNTAKMIKTLALERQNLAMTASQALRIQMKGPHSELVIENGTPGNHSKYFWVKTTLKDKDFCQALKESNLIQADLIEVNGQIGGKCQKNSQLAFYFKKNTSSDENLTWVDEEGNIQKCPDNSSACDNQGNATACERGYYLDNGNCPACGTHVSACENENTPIECEKGYKVYANRCVPLIQSCITDSDCNSVCAICDNAICTEECEIPKPDKNNNCGQEQLAVIEYKGKIWLFSVIKYSFPIGPL